MSTRPSATRCPSARPKRYRTARTAARSPDPSGYGTVEKCYPKYVNKKYCVNENKCEKKKYTKCYNVAAYCVKYYYYEHPKYCAKAQLRQAVRRLGLRQSTVRLHLASRKRDED